MPLDGITGAIAGQALGMMLGDQQDKRQIRQQKKLQKEQIKGNKELADYNQQLQFDMWNKTNYGAQVEHLKTAGLNPGLIYGMGGAGGATTGSGGGGSVTSGTPTDPSNAQQANMAMGMMMAQQRVLETQAEKMKSHYERTKNKIRGKIIVMQVIRTMGIINKHFTDWLTKNTK